MSAWITTVDWAKVVSMIYWTTLQEFYHTVKEYQYEHVFTPVPTFMWFLRFKLTLSPNKLHPLPGDWRKIKLIVIANQHEDVEIFISTKNLAARRTGVSAANHVSDWCPPAITKCSKNRMWKINFTVKPKRPKVCFDCVPIVKEAGSLVAHRPGTGRCLRIQVEFFLVPNYGN